MKSPKLLISIAVIAVLVLGATFIPLPNMNDSAAAGSLASGNCGPTPVVASLIQQIVHRVCETVGGGQGGSGGGSLPWVVIEAIRKGPPAGSGITLGCTLTTDKKQYKVGETIMLTWSSQTALHTYFDSTPDNKKLGLPTGELEKTGSTSVVATSRGIRKVTLLIDSGYKSRCSTTIVVKK